MKITRQWRPFLALAVVTAAGMSISACQSSGSTVEGSKAPVVVADADKEVPAATITVTPAEGSTSVRPDAEVTVRVQNGTLESVAVSGADTTATGQMSSDKSSWVITRNLLPSTEYTVNARAKSRDGQIVTTTSRLRTLKPRDTASYSLLPGGGTVGVGMPVVVQFASEVAKDKRDDVERRVSLVSSPKTQGAWGWLDSRQLVWRPADYWQPGTQVSVKADIAGIETRSNLWTARNASTSFTIGSAMVSTVDVKQHTMTVRRNGEVLRTIPITTGKEGFLTRNGIKVILSRESSRTMDAETTGIKKDDPEYYNLTVKWAMRLTWSGEFLHAAPWSVSSQGVRNVSHGCTGMSTSNAQWMYDNSKQGDVVKYINSSRELEEYNGYTMWNMSLEQWAAKSALN